MPHIVGRHWLVRRRVAVAMSLAALVFGSGAATAQQCADGGRVRMIMQIDGPLDVAHFLSNYVKPNQLTTVVSNARAVFYRFDFDLDDAVGPNDIKARDEDILRGLRNRLIAELLQCDLNGDGLVTREEVVELINRQIRRGDRLRHPTGQTQEMLRTIIDRHVEFRMKFDGNADGTIDFGEMLAFAKQAKPDGTNADELRAVIAAFDADGDGVVTLVEFDQIAERYFQAVDTNGDGLISKEEADTYQASRKSPPRGAASAPSRQTMPLTPQ